jgi:hypothetical protein
MEGQPGRVERLVALRKELSWFYCEVEGLSEARQLMNVIDFMLEPEPEYEPDPPMSEKARKIFNSIIFAHIPEENILRLTEEDLEEGP